MKTDQKKIIWRVAIFNQIFNTKYYHVRKYALNEKTGKYRPTKDVIGHRGPGGHLGITSRVDACELADKLNSK